MGSSRLSFEKIIRFQIYSCIVFVIFASVLSFFGPIRVEPIYVFEDFFGEQNPEDRVSDAVTENFNIGIADVIVGIPDLSKAILFDNGDVTEFDEYGNRIGKYIEENGAEKQYGLTKYSYLVFSTLDENFVAGIILVLQLVLDVLMPVIGTACTVIMLLKWNARRNGDRFSCYQEMLRSVKPLVSVITALMIVSALLPNVKLSPIGVIITVCLLAFIIVNFVFAQMKEYTYAQRKYLWMIQIGSVVSLLSLAFYVFGIVKALVIPKMSELSEAETWEFAEMITQSGSHSLVFRDVFYLFVAFVCLWLVVFSFRMSEKNLERMICNTQRKRFGNVTYPEFFFFPSVIPALSIAITLLSGLKYENGEAAWLIVAAVSAAVVFISELMLKILRGTLCIDLGSSGAEVVLYGDVYDRRDE